MLKQMHSLRAYAVGSEDTLSDTDDVIVRRDTSEPLKGNFQL